MLPRIWLLLLAVFAFVSHPEFVQLAASARVAVVFAVSTSELVILIIFLALHLFAPAGILVH